MASLILNPQSSQLGILYERAFREARELYIVSAYLTAWNTGLQLNGDCKIRIVIGKDFGITRKDACRKLLEWLPANRKQNFYVAAYIGGFHPKAMFWRDQTDKYYILVGSSNLTEAAFQTNYEANLYARVSHQLFRSAVRWFEQVLTHSRPVDNDWLATYQEARLTGRKKGHTAVPVPANPSKDFPLPEINDESFTKDLRLRRRQVKDFEKIRIPLRRLFNDGAANRLSNGQICSGLLRLWDSPKHRFQGKGWERTGVNSDWQLFSRGLTEILNANNDQRDDVVVSIIDEFALKGLPTRKAFLSEMLCHFFPDQYPVINGPVQLWIRKMRYRASAGASEGAKYIDMASKMRATLAHSDGPHKPRNLAELDIIIWAKYGGEYLSKRREYI